MSKVLIVFRFFSRTDEELQVEVAVEESQGGARNGTDFGATNCQAEKSGLEHQEP